ncbi:MULTISPECIES: hypothetical protein [unclassified Methylobacterium]|jgi:RecA/RadA recombinase|uniref:hypothetical protein n=1 Tax=unclassified Methylobacterium TaxID=2615210 RepID=UPI00135540F9|nr:hypothetical protein [Methylobacterium sp. 2A]MWV24712.1 hypothetical protein [Methylobacterium sp. 2A]
MIVELFGPPGAGKTTFARGLAAGLRARGYAAEAVVSARTSEAERDGPVRARGPVGGAASGHATAQPDARRDGLGRSLLTILPPRNVFWNLRLRRYLRRLAAAWARSEAVPGIRVFDQGYAQALCSLISLSRSTDPGRIAMAAALLPRPALRIALHAPGELLAARQEARVHKAGLLERMLELDAATNLRQAGICDTLFGTFQGSAPLLRTTSLDEASMAGFVDTVAAATTQWSRVA